LCACSDYEIGHIHTFQISVTFIWTLDRPGHVLLRSKMYGLSPAPVTRAHSFLRKILPNSVGTGPACEIPRLTTTKSSKFRGWPRPHWESCSETSVIEGWHCTMKGRYALAVSG